MNRNEQLHRAIREYLQSRGREGRQSIREFAAEHPAIEQDLLQHLACREFENEWREAARNRDNGRPLELVLKDFPELRQSPDAMLELLSIETQYQPSIPDADKFVGRLPQIEALVRSFFDVFKQQDPDEWDRWVKAIRRGVLASHSGCAADADHASESTASPRPAERGADDAGGVEQPTASQSATAFADGDVVDVTDRIEVVQYLDKGSSKWVFEAFQSSTGRPIALKQLKSLNPEQFEQFVSEGCAQGRLDHQNIPPIFVMAPQQGDRSFLLEKLVSAPDWSESIRDPGIPLERKLRILLSVSRAAEYAHRQHGIVHRDIKPQNVLVGPYGEVFLIDWGLAVSTRDQSIAPTGSSGDAAENNTGNQPSSSASYPIRRLRDEPRGTGLGTPAYLAPEAAMGLWDDCSPATDVYLLGAILYEILSGHAPFEGFMNTAWFRAATQRFEPLPDSTPDELAFITGKAMSRSPSDRYEDAGHFADAIEQFLEHLPAEQQTHQAAENLSTLHRDIEQAHASRSPMAPLMRRLISAADQFRQAREIWLEVERRVAATRAGEPESSSTGNPFRTRGIDRTLEGELEARRELVSVATSNGDLLLAQSQVEELVLLSGADQVQELSQQVTRRRQQRTLTRGLAWTAVVVAIGAVTVSLFLRSERAELVAENARISEKKAEAEAQAERDRADKADALLLAEQEEARRLKVESEAAASAAQQAIDARNADLLRLVQRNETVGTLALNRDDPASALAWFADATRQMQQHTEQDKKDDYLPTARGRLSTLVSEFPFLERVVPTRQLVHSVKLSADQNWLILTSIDAGNDLRISRWNTMTGLPEWTVDEGMSGEGANITFELHEHQPFEPRIAISPDDRWVAVSAMVPKLDLRKGGLGLVGTVLLYSAETGERVGDPINVEDVLYEVQFSSDSRRLATVTTFGKKKEEDVYDPVGQIRIWDVNEDGVISASGEPMVLQGTVHDVAFSDDLSRAVVQTSSVSSAEAVPPNDDDATNSSDEVQTAKSSTYLETWDTVKGERLNGNEPESVSVLRVAITGDGKTVFASDHTRLWFMDFESSNVTAGPIAIGGSLVRLDAFEDRVVAVTRRDDQAFAIEAVSPSRVSMWDAAGNSLILPLTVEHMTQSVSVRREGESDDWIVLGTAQGDVQVVSTKDRQLTPWLRHSEQIVFAEATIDHRLIIVTAGGTITTWDLDRDGLGNEYPESKLIVGNRPSAAANKDTEKRLPPRARHLAISPSGKWLVTAGDPRGGGSEGQPSEQRSTVPSNANELVLWDVRTERPLRDPIIHSQPLDLAQFSDDEKLLVVASSVFPKSEGHISTPSTSLNVLGQTVGGIKGDEGGPPPVPSRIWCYDVASGTPTMKPVAFPGRIGEMQFLPGGKLLIGGSEIAEPGTAPTSGVLAILDLSSGEFIGNHQKAVMPIVDLSQSSESNRLISIDGNGGIQVWTLDGTELRKHGDPLGPALMRADISPDGRYVVTGTYNREPLTLWDLDSGAKPWSTRWHTDGISSIEFHPTEPWFLSASSDGWVVVWDYTDPWETKLKLRIPVESKVQDATWSPDGRLIAVLDENFGSRVFTATGEAFSMRSAPELFGVGSLRFSLDSRQLHIFRSGNFGYWRPGQFFVRDFSPDNRDLTELLEAAERIAGLRMPDVDAESGRPSLVDLESLRSRVSPAMIARELSTGDENWFLHYQMGLMLAEQGLHQNAVAAFTKAVELTEPPRYLLHARARSYEQLNDRQARIADLRRGFEHETAPVQELNDLAVELAISDPDAAEPLRDELLRRFQSQLQDPTDLNELVVSVSGQFVGPMIAGQRGDLDTALKGFLDLNAFHEQLFPGFSRLAPEAVGLTDFIVSNVYLAKRDLNGFREMCLRLVSDPEVLESPVRVNNLARSVVMIPKALDVAHLEPLLRLTGESAAVQPLNAGRQIIYGQLLYRAGRFDEAIKALEVAIDRIGNAHSLDRETRDLDRRMPYLWLAMAQHEAGQVESARQTYAMAIAEWERIRNDDKKQFAPAERNWLAEVADRYLLPEAKETLGIAADAEQ